MKTYPRKTITNEKIRIAGKTNMVELVEEEYENFPDDADFKSAYASRKVEVLKSPA